MFKLLQGRARQVPGVIKFLVVAPCVALAIYWSATYSGLARLLAEWQLARYGSYSPRNTIGVVFIVCLIPAALVVQIIGWRIAARRARAAAPPPA